MRTQKESLPSSYSIGTLARVAGVGVETIRFYEREGMLTRPTKPASGARQYPQTDLVKVIFIKRLQGLGFTLREARELLEMNTRPNSSCSDIKAKTIKKLDEIEAKIQDLRAMKKTLKELLQACGKGQKASRACNVMNCFEMKCEC